MRDTSEMKDYIYSLRTKCNRCEIDNPDVLVFHHINPSMKECDIGPHLTKEKIDEEIRKCEILCFNCHMLVHRKLKIIHRMKPEAAKKSAELSRIGANIARGRYLKESLQKLDIELLMEIYKIIKHIIPDTNKKPKDNHLVPHY